MFRSRSSNAASRAKAARELEREIMTMEVVSGDESHNSSPQQQQQREAEMPDRLVFGPYGIAPLRGLHFDADQDTAAS